MKRSMKHGGGGDHLKLVKLATKKLVDEFDDLQGLTIDYEKTEFRVNFKMLEEGWEPVRLMNAEFEFRPDIVVKTGRPLGDYYGPLDKFMEDEERIIKKTRLVIIEAETDPRNIFRNTIKMEAYKRIKGEELGRRYYSFVLACFDDTTVPKDIEPFDELWLFKRSEE